MLFQIPNYMECRNVVIDITLRVSGIAFAVSVNFNQIPEAHRNACPVSMLCCKAKAMKRLIIFQFIACQGGDKNGNFPNAILLLSVLKLRTAC